MKKLLLILAFIIPTICKAQTSNDHINKSNDFSRYTIVQSPTAVKATFKLDTYTGNISQLVRDTTGKELWQRMIRFPTLHPDTQYPNQKNYNLFVSTLGVRYTYLINSNTGTTWQLFHDANLNVDFFKPMDDQ